MGWWRGRGGVSIISGTTQWKFIRIGQNIQTEAEVLVERSIFADVFYHLVTCSLNWKLNGSREGNVHCSLWNENDQSCRQRFKVLFPGFLLTVVIENKTMEVSFDKSTTYNVSLSVNWIVVNFSSAPWIQQSKEVWDYRRWLHTGGEMS